MDLKFIRTLEMRATAPGVDDASAKLNKLQAAHDGVSKSAAATATVTDRAAKSQLSLAAEVEKLERRFFPVIRAQQEFEKVERRLMTAAAAHPEIQGRANAVIAQAAQHYDRMAVAATESAKSMTGNVAASKLSRYELINLSRQVQDVGVSLASGQSPLMVLVQQGTQIADVFASSQTKMTDVFRQLVSGAASVITPMRLVGAAGLAMGAAAVVSAFNWRDAQRDISTALTGIGRESGASLGSVNRIISESVKNTRLYKGEAADLAIELINTGRIGVEQFAGISRLAFGASRILGVEMPEANKILAASFADPAKGIDTLAAKFGGVSAAMREQVKDLAQQGKLGEAQQLMQRLFEGTARAAERVGALEAAWRGAGQALGSFWEQFNRGLDRLAGLNSVEDKITMLERRLRGLRQQETFETGQQTPGASLREGDTGASANIKKVIADIAELRVQQKLAGSELSTFVDQIGKEFGEVSANGHVSFTNLGRDLAALGSKFAPEIDRIREMRNALQFLSNIDRPEVRAGMSADQVRSVEQVRDAFKATVGFVDQARASFAGFSDQTAVQLSLMGDQLNVADALGGARRMAAQEQATTNQLMSQSIAQEEAQAIAAKQREIAQAQINTQARETLAGLRDQFAVASAVTGVEKIRAQAVATTTQMLRDGVDPSIAMAVGAQQMANSFAAVEASARGALLALNDQLSVVQAAGTSARFQAQEQATINQLTREGVSLATARAVAEAQTAIVKQNEVNQTQQLLLASREALNVASARTGAERIQAQLLADIAAARRQYAGNDLAQTQAIEAAWNKARAAVEKVNSAILDQVHVLEQDSQMIQARLDGATKEELARLKAAQAYENAIRQGASAWAASALSASVLKNEMLKIEEAVMRTANQMGGLVRGLGVQRAELQVTEESGGVGSGAWMTGLAQQAMIDNMRKRMKEFEENISKHFGTQVDVVLSSGGSLKQAIDQLRANPLSMQGAGLDTLTDLYKRLGEEDKAGAIGGMQQLIAELQMLPRTLARDDQMKNLKNAIESLTDSTDALNSTMQVGLDPIFTAGHEALRIGYFNSGGSRNNNSGMTFDAPQVIGAPTVPALPAPLPMPMPGPSPIGPMAPWNYFGAAIRAANGLEGTVAGSGGVDSRELRVMVTPGELVRITTPAQQMQPTKTSEPDRRTTELLQELVTISKEPRFRERRRPGSHETRLSPRQRMQGF